MSGSLPGLFIVGAPKCGTTSLALWLGFHPEIFMSSPKEPCHFCADLAERRGITDRSDYLKLFVSPAKRARYLGEASTWYLYSQEAISAILKFNPDARIIVMIRNPLQLAQSLHGHEVLNGVENVTDFSKAWRSQAQRTRQGWAQYGRIAMLGAQLARASNIVPRGQLRVIVFDDLKNRPEQVYQDLLAWLDLAPFRPAQFDAKNQARAPRSARLAQFISNTPPPLSMASGLFKKLLGIQEWGLLERVRDWNQKPVTRQPIDAQTHNIMCDFFQEDTLRLSALVGRDLSHWVERTDPVP